MRLRDFQPGDLVSIYFRGWARPFSFKRTLLPVGDTQSRARGFRTMLRALSWVLEWTSYYCEALLNAANFGLHVSVNGGRVISSTYLMMVEFPLHVSSHIPILLLRL